MKKNKDGSSWRVEASGLEFTLEFYPVSIEKIDHLASEVEAKVLDEARQEVTTTEIGELVIKGLKDLDEVAYVRFASVYRQFKDINTFMQELKNLLGEK